jgi:hypothetical protein
VSENSALPQPNPALERLDRLVGTWTMEGRLVGSDETTIKGDTTFSWLAGASFSSSVRIWISPGCGSSLWS